MGHSKIRMIALDLDNTTLRTDKSLADRTRQALVQAAERGVYVVISTGRVLTSLPPQMLEVSQIRYAVCSNGARIYRLPEKEQIYENGIGEDAARKALEILRDAPGGIEVFTNGHAYMGRDQYESIRDHGSNLRNAKYVLWSREPVDDPYRVMEDNIGELENVSTFFEDPQLRLDYIDRLNQIEGLTVTSSEPDNIELGGTTTSKAGALRWLMDQLGVEVSELMACGDSPNDEQMIRLAGLGVAMANGAESTRAAADYITDSNDEDGVAKAVEKFVLNV